MSAEPLADDRTLDFLLAEEDDRQGGDKGLFGRGPAVQPVSVAALRQHVADAVGKLKDVFAGLDIGHPDLPLKEVTVSFEVSAKGKVTLIGTGSEIGGKGALTLTFGK